MCASEQVNLDLQNGLSWLFASTNNREEKFAYGDFSE